MRKAVNRVLLTIIFANKIILLAASIFLLAILVTIFAYLRRETSLISPPINESNVAQYCGWAGEDKAREAWAQIKHLFPKFKIAGEAEDNSKKRVVLWDASKVVLSGQHIPTFRQEIGDCVGAGAKQAIEYLQCAHIAFRGLHEEFKPVFSPYHYACGRQAPECGKGQIRGPDGSVGSWQAKALELYGVIPVDAIGLPEYSKQTVTQWAVKMPATAWVQLGRMHLVGTAAQVNSADEVRDSICNWYPITIASNWGGEMRPRESNGKLINRRVTRWNHQMAIIGYDGTGPEPLWYILNSWGADAHGNPPDGSPPGGFWVRRADIEYIVKQGDSFALSDLVGFPARDLDLTPIGVKQIRDSSRYLSQVMDGVETHYSLTQ